MKKLLGVGLSVFAVGAVVFGIAFAMGGFDFSKLNTSSPYEEKTYVFAGAVSSVSLDDENTSVYVGLSEDKDTHVTYFENDNESYEISKGKELAMKKKRSYSWFDNIISINFIYPDVKILLPKDFVGEVEIDTSNAKIETENITPESLNVETSNGTIILSSINTKDEIEAKTTNSLVAYKDITVGGELVISSSNGKLNLENTRANSIDIKTTNDGITLTGVSAVEELKAVSSNGEIVLEKISAGSEISLKSSNNSVKGTILGKLSDFTVDTKTSNGENNLPEKMAGGNKELYIHSTNGDINIDFQ